VGNHATAHCAKIIITTKKLWQSESLHNWQNCCKTNLARFFWLNVVANL